jgi:hypothetical protein
VNRHLHLVDAYATELPPGRYLLYASVFDPVSERSGGTFVPFQIEPMATEGLRISPIVIAAGNGGVADRSLMLQRLEGLTPYPGRDLLYGEDLWLHFEITGLARSEFGDHAWEESFYIVPSGRGEGIVRIDPGMLLSGLESSVRRQLMLDLNLMASTYEGEVFVVAIITDAVSGTTAASATRFNIGRP